MANMFTELVSTEKDLYNILTESYTLAFGTKHAWLIRKAAPLAMYSAGSR